jgi:hypothetical protein
VIKLDMIQVGEIQKESFRETEVASNRNANEERAHNRAFLSEGPVASMYEAGGRSVPTPHQIMELSLVGIVAVNGGKMADEMH